MEKALNKEGRAGDVGIPCSNSVFILYLNFILFLDQYAVVNVV